VDVGVAGVARDENGGIEVGQVGAAVADQQVAYRDIGCGNGQRRSLAIAVNDGSGAAPKGYWFINSKVAFVEAGIKFKLHHRGLLCRVLR